MPVLATHQYAASGGVTAVVGGARGVTLSYNDNVPNAQFYDWLLAMNVARNGHEHALKAAMQALDRLRAPASTATRPIVDGAPPTSVEPQQASPVTAFYDLARARVEGAIEPKKLSVFKLLERAHPVIGWDRLQRPWRNLHYDADDFMELGARQAYTEARVVAAEAWCEHKLDASCTLTTSLTEAARLCRTPDGLSSAVAHFSRAVPPSRISCCNTLESFIAAGLARQLKKAASQVRVNAYAALAGTLHRADL